MPLLITVALLLLMVFGLSMWLRGTTPEPQAVGSDDTVRRHDAAARADAQSLPATMPPPLSSGASETPEKLRKETEGLGHNVVRRFPHDAGAMAARARLEFRMGKSDEAKKWWEKSLEADAGHAPSYRGLAQIAADRGDYQNAVVLRRKVLDLEPASTQARAGLAEALLKLGEPRQVVALLEGFDRADPATFYLRGQAQLQLEDYEGAEHSYVAALKLRPGWDVAYYGLITALARSGRAAESAGYMQRFQESRAIERQMRKDVRADYDDAYLMRQELADAYTETGDVYARRGVMADAEVLWRRAASLDPQNATCRWRLVSLYEQTGRDALARQSLEEMAVHQPGNVQCRIALGVLLARTGQLDGAEGAFRDAIQLAPRLSMGYQQLARLLMAANRDFAAARTAAEQAVRLEPSAENYAVLGASLRMNGDVSGAIEALKEAMRLDPGNTDYPRIHASLRNDL